MRDGRSNVGEWVKDAQVFVEGDSEVKADRSTWKTMAVLEVHPRGVAFYVGWRTEQFAEAEFYSEEVPTVDAKFAMEVGDKGVWFVVRSADRHTRMVVELVEVVSRSDPRYNDLYHL